MDYSIASKYVAAGDPRREKKRPDFVNGVPYWMYVIQKYLPPEPKQYQP